MLPGPSEREGSAIGCVPVEDGPTPFPEGLPLAPGCMLPLPAAAFEAEGEPAVFTDGEPERPLVEAPPEAAGREGVPPCCGPVADPTVLDTVLVTGAVVLETVLVTGAVALPAVLVTGAAALVTVLVTGAVALETVLVTGAVVFEPVVVTGAVAVVTVVVAGAVALLAVPVVEVVVLETVLVTGAAAFPADEFAPETVEEAEDAVPLAADVTEPVPDLAEPFGSPAADAAPPETASARTAVARARTPSSTKRRSPEVRAFRLPVVPARPFMPVSREKNGTECVLTRARTVPRFSGS